VALPAAVIMIYSGVQQRNHAINDALMDTQRLADRIASEQQILIASARQLVESVSQLPEVKNKDIFKVNLFLHNIFKLNNSMTIVFIADRSGTIWASALPLAHPITVYDRRYFKDALASGRLSSGEFQIDRILHKPTFNLGYPYKNDHGEIIGIVGVEITLESYKVILERTQLPEGASIYLLDHKGLVEFGDTDPEKFIGKQFNPVLFRNMLEGPDADTLRVSGILEDSPNQERFISYRKLRLEGEQSPYMYVRVGIPVESVLSQANKQLLRNMSMLSLVLASALFLAWLVGKRSIVNRINVLEKATRNLVSDGPFVIVSELIKGGELGRLGESFDIMTQRLGSKAKLLADKQHQLEELNAYLEQRVADAVLDSRKKDQILIQQGRQAAMGEMISNIAHQWRQPLNTLGLIVQELKMTYGRDEFNRESLDSNVKKAMALIFNMSQTINDFSNYFQPDKEKMLFNVSQAVGRTLSLIEPSLKDLSINIEISRTDDTHINGYANEYSQVLLNILLNCKDAFEGCNIDRKKVITITISKKNNKSVVTIADNAGGIPKDIIDKIFDPYFTTKGPDKGTGIGLYMAKTIIEKNMEGSLTVRNNAVGAEFRIEV
jgi:C4-dicarboxylate-specific signal transduction histidine kinase